MKALIFDTETTGLLSSHLMPHERQPEVIEYSGMLTDLDTGEILEDYTTLVNPQKPISQEIAAITGLTQAQLNQAPRFGAVADTISAQLEKAPIVIAHNASFDREMLDLEYERLNRKLSWPFTLCTVEQTIYLVGRRLNLTDLHVLLFNEPFKDAHRAGVDVMALVKCCIELHRRNVI